MTRQVAIRVCSTDTPRPVCLGHSLAAMALCMLLPSVWLLRQGAAEDAVSASGRVAFDVVERAGIHRDASPVHALVRFPEAVPVGTPCRLLLKGKPVVAQFRPHGKGSTASGWWVDFLARSLPYETRRYVVEYGPEVEPVPERTGGHVLTVVDDTFVVSNEPYIDWVVPRDLRGFLRSVDFPPAEHLRPDSLGLQVRDRTGGSHLLGGVGTTAEVVRQGRMTVALRFERAETSDGLRGVKWRADLVFPGPVSWVDLRLRIEDPEDRVAAVGLQLRLNLDPPTGTHRTLVELGAARTVYRSLFGNQYVELRGNLQQASPWQVLRGVAGNVQPFMVAAKGSPAAAGWAHVMDRQRCLAIAFDRFGEQGEERLGLSAEGRLSAWKQFPKPSPEPRPFDRYWRCWLHFVHFPPQQSATTDPYMMQHPLVVKRGE
ncbi:MAG: hypothetical protein VX346_29065 [Planctomycetota bacterium]|nr:hypothetical protein [Planctomycetota bacterium]